MLRWFHASAAPTSVTCTGESNLTILSAVADPGGSRRGCFALLDNVTASGNKTITANFGSSVSHRGITVQEIVGADTSDILDVQGTTSNSTANPVRALTTTVANAALFGFCGINGSDPTAGSGFTLVDIGQTIGGATSEYKLDAGAAGSKNVDFVAASNNHFVAAVALVPAPALPLDFSHTGTGGVSVGGTAGVQIMPYNHVASGGVSVGGSATVAILPFHAVGSGGLAVGGSAEVRSVVRKAVEIPYSLRLQSSFDIPYHIRLNVAKAVELPWTTRVSAAFDITNDFRGTVQSGADINYSLAERSPVSAAVELCHSLRLQAGFDIGYSLRPKVRSGVDLCWNVRSAVKTPVEMRYTLKLRNQVSVGFTTIWSLTQPYVQNVTDQPHLVHQGRQVAILDGDISASEGGFGWEGNFTLASVEDYVRFQKDDVFEANLYGESWTFIVDGKELSRQEPAGVSTRIIAISPSARYTNPRAERRDYEWDTPVSALAAAQEVTSASTIWAILDWVIPAYRLAFSEAEPLDVVRRLAEAAGGIVESTLEGVLRVRPLYPISPQDYRTATPDHVFLELQDIIEASETYGYSRVENRFRLMDVQQTNQDRLEWVPDNNGALNGYMRAYPSPWRTNVILSHTANPLTLSIGAQEESFREEEELVEIFKGQGNTQYPIYDILSLEWEATNLGGIVHALDGTDVFAVGPQFNSLVRIKYRTRFLNYRVVSSSGHPAQFLLESALE